MVVVSPALRSVLIWRRRLSAACVLAGLLALTVAFAAEHYAGLVPCPLCLWERWPYRALIVLGGIGALLPRSFGRTAVTLGIIAALAGAVIALVHVGVEQHWWPSPLPECAAPRLGHGSVAQRLAAMPARPSKPCDEPVVPVPSLPVSMACMDAIYALAIAAGLTMFHRRTARPRRNPAPRAAPSEATDV